MSFLHPGTYSRDPSAFGFPEDVLIQKARGSRVTIQGREYVDTVMGLGSYVRGYDPQINLRVVQALGFYNGAVHSLAPELWPEVRDLVLRSFGLAAVQPVRTGSDGCLAACMLARAARPGRVGVVQGNYHGQWLQWNPPAKGSLLRREEICVIDPDRQATWPEPKQLSCVIFEVPTYAHPDGWWRYLQALQDFGVILIADEVVTCLRHPRGFASREFLEADLFVFGKAVSNGYGGYFVGGRADLIAALAPPEPVFVSSTYAGDLIALAATKANLTLEPTNLAERLFALGQRLWAQLDHAFFLNGPVKVQGQPTRFVFVADPETLTRFRYACWKRGVLVNRPVAISLAHEGDLDLLAEVFRDALEEVKRGKEEIPWQVPQPLFSNR